MPEVRNTCPDCGSIDVEIARPGLHTAGEAEAHCPNCEWSGVERNTIGVVTSENFWDIERVGAVLLRVISKWGVGPMCQVFEFVGLIEKDDEEARSEILREASAACIQAAFETAHTIHLRKQRSTPKKKMSPQEKKLARAAWKREQN
jgi:hypothetical protein